MEQPTCQCGSAIESVGRGRPRKYCLECLPRKRALQARSTERTERPGVQCRWQRAPRKPCAACGGPTGYRATDTRGMSPVCLGCRAKAQQRKSQLQSTTEWTCETCGISCNRPPTKGQRPRFCGKRCQQSAADRRRRALEAKAFIEDVPRHSVFEADGYRCHLCGRKTDKSKSIPHRRAPTIDHLLPLSKGGKHERSNCRTACFGCNCAKQDRGGGEQFVLAV